MLEGFTLASNSIRLIGDGAVIPLCIAQAYFTGWIILTS
jgi:hypothetical protein